MASRQASKMPEDSLKYWRLSKIVVAADILNDSLLFKNASSSALKLAAKLKKPNLLGDAYWNFGAYFLNHKKYDSSYFHYNKAYKVYTSMNNYYYAGKMLYNMAYISSIVNDYTGAEIHLYRAIENFERKQKHKQLYLSFNLLGTIAENIGEYQNALKHYNKASLLIPKIEDSQYEQVENWNNIGLIFHRLKKYQQAVNFFNKGLETNHTKTDRPSLFAKLLDNKAFTLLTMGVEKNSIDLMNASLFIRDSIGDTAGSVINRIHLSKYYARKGDTTKAIKYAKTAFEMASKTNLNRDILQSLELLALIDLDNKTTYLEQHIFLDKQLNARERSIRNKFTAIRYDTEKYISENEKLFKERTLILASSCALIFMLLLIYWNTRQKSRNKELLFEREQQQYTEDMFLLALENKTTVERGRSQERLRISQELHDGILARLFSVRFKWAFIDLHGNPENLSEHKKSIDQLTDIETEIRNISHDLRNELIWNEIEFINEIENAIKEKSEVGQFKFILTCENNNEWQSLDYLIKINISRMMDEIFQNIIKHSGATEVIILFTLEKNTYFISVRDNGKGFNNYYIKKGIGLKNLQNRCKKINGKLTIKSVLGKGSLTEITFPKKS